MTQEGSKRIYDLEKRTGDFGKEIILFAKLIKIDTVHRPLVSQLARSGTSVGANYCEANDAESRKDFHHKLGIAKKEARETMHWLYMISVASPHLSDKSDILKQEAKELNLIFNAIIHSSKRSESLEISN